MASLSPQLIKQTALAKTTQLESRVNQLVASSTTGLSPVVVYLSGAVANLSVNGSVSAAGTWTCPAGVSTAQVECWGAGGGGGGGTTTNGGGGGGGGEYAAEPSYAVIPGNVYTYAVGREGQGGVAAGTGGWSGGTTIFDTTANGVVANGGMGGDGPTNVNGGSGSANSVHLSGGNGGVSSAGVASDNPSSLSNLMMWWRMDENNSTAGYITKASDKSGHNRYGTCYAVEPGPPVTSGIIATAGIAPAQVPTQTTTGTSSTQAGNAAYFKQDTSNKTNSAVSAPLFTLGSTAAAPFDGSHLTVSCWVRADTALNSWGSIPVYGHQYVVLVGDTNIPGGLNSGYTRSDSNGFGLFLQNGQPGFYLNDHAFAGGGRSVLGSALPVNTTWHQIVGTWDGTTMTLYVDGASVGTATPGFSRFGSGPSAVCAGINPVTRTDSLLTGYLSNVWITASTASSGFVATAYGTTPQTGGAGGGASGGSAAAGVGGASGAGSSGGAAGTAAAGLANMGGSGAGGAGGNAAANGSSAPVSTPYGGGGGGAGASASTGAVTTLSVPAIQSASYCGFDAQGGNAGALYSISSAPQTGVVTPYPAASLVSSNVYVGGTPSAAFNGSFSGMVLFPKLLPQLNGKTVNTMTLTFTVQSTNASVLPVWVLVAGPGVTQLPASFGSAADITAFTGGVYAPVNEISIPIPAGAAGRTITFDITNSTLASYFSAGNLVALMFGGFQGEVTYDIGDGAYSDPDAFAWNTVITGANADSQATDMSLNFELYPVAASNKVGGDGAPGSLILSFIDPRYWPVCAIEPAAATDSDGHTFAAGVTTDSVVGFDPTVVTPPRVPETWHTLGSLAGGSGLTMSVARYRYAPDDGGTLVLEVAYFIANGTVVTGGQYAFSVTLPAALRPTVSVTAGNDVLGFPVTNVNGGSFSISTTLFGVLISGRNNIAPGKVQLLVNFTGTASGGSWNTACLRIPLT